MENNLKNMEANLDEQDKIKHKEDIQNNQNHLNSLKGKTSSEWREYATKCMIEILDNKKRSMSNKKKYLLSVSLTFFAVYHLVENI